MKQAPVQFLKTRANFGPKVSFPRGHFHEDNCPARNSEKGTDSAVALEIGDSPNLSASPYRESHPNLRPKPYRKPVQVSIGYAYLGAIFVIFGLIILSLHAPVESSYMPQVATEKALPKVGKIGDLIWVKDVGHSYYWDERFKEWQDP